MVLMIIKYAKTRMIPFILELKKINVLYISKREAYETFILKKGNEKWQRKSFSFYVSKTHLPFSLEESEFFKKQYENCKVFKKYSFEWYYYLINEEIKFLEDHFPKIFTNGQWQ